MLISLVDRGSIKDPCDSDSDSDDSLKATNFFSVGEINPVSFLWTLLYDVLNSLFGLSFG